jgi:hypothetical protein
MDDRERALEELYRVRESTDEVRLVWVSPSIK